MSLVQCIHLPGEGHLGCFQICYYKWSSSDHSWACDFISASRSRLAGSWGNLTLDATTTRFSKLVWPFYLPASNEYVFWLLNILVSIGYCQVFLVLAIFMHVELRLIMVLVLISLMSSKTHSNRNSVMLVWGPTHMRTNRIGNLKIDAHG